MSNSAVNTAAEVLFSALGGNRPQMTALAQNALSRGAELYTKGDYDGAAREFKRAAALDPSESNVVQAYDLLATVYIGQGKTDDAVKACRTAISMSPANSAPRVKLGNLYFGSGRYADAEREYLSAVRVDPYSSANHYSLGQAYLANGKLEAAEQQFRKVIGMDRNHHGGYYALGQVYAREGRFEEALAAFDKTISLKPDFYEAYVDKGSAYADLGRMDEARQQLRILETGSPGLAPVLGEYIAGAAAPRFLGAYNASGFDQALGPGTAVSSLDPLLTEPNASHQFNMVFIFSKEMEAESVRNISLWSITRSSPGSRDGGYNWGLTSPETEAQVSPLPVRVDYLPESLSATVWFTVHQNSNADATIDPSHLTFRFRGTDSYAKTMDSAADEFNGVSLIA
jgi:tetratricopeptide (TPR) repeat protein